MHISGFVAGNSYLHILAMTFNLILSIFHFKIFYSFIINVISCFNTHYINIIMHLYVSLGLYDSQSLFFFVFFATTYHLYIMHISAFVAGNNYLHNNFILNIFHFSINYVLHYQHQLYKSRHNANQSVTISVLNLAEAAHCSKPVCSHQDPGLNSRMLEPASTMAGITRVVYVEPCPATPI